jgi:hypothetical protein
MAQAVIPLLALLLAFSPTKAGADTPAPRASIATLFNRDGKWISKAVDGAKARITVRPGEGDSRQVAFEFDRASAPKLTCLIPSTVVPDKPFGVVCPAISGWGVCSTAGDACTIALSGPRPITVKLARRASGKAFALSLTYPVLVEPQRSFRGADGGEVRLPELPATSVLTQERYELMAAPARKRGS